MSKKDSYYWAGQGVYNFEGFDYRKGDKLPDAVPAETLQALLEKGKVSTSPLAAPAVVQADGELVALREQVQDLRASVTALTAERDGLAQQLAAAQKTIEEMTAAQLTAVPVAPAAGPKK